MAVYSGNRVMTQDFVSGEPTLSRYTRRLRGAWLFLFRFGRRLRGYDRGIEDASLRRFELYVGAGVEPDLTAAPAVTGTSLPLVYTPPSAGEYRLLLWKRNGFGVASGNTISTTVVMDDDGATGSDPVGPVEDVVVEVSGFAVRVTGHYLGDGFAAPTHFIVESSQLTSGAPDVQSVEVTMDPTVDGVGYLETVLTMKNLATLPAQTGVVEVRVRAARLEADEVTVTPGAEELVEVDVPREITAEVRGVLSEEETGRAF